MIRDCNAADFEFGGASVDDGPFAGFDVGPMAPIGFQMKHAPRRHVRQDGDEGDRLQADASI